jgi:glutamate-1-semialdehyde 2,1-aminomutase
MKSAERPFSQRHPLPGGARLMITDLKSNYRLLTALQLAGLRAREDALFLEPTPKSRATFVQAQEMLLNGVPMPWMGDWGTPPDLRQFCRR